MTGQMAKEFFLESPLLILPLFGLMIFIALFISVVVFLATTDVGDAPFIPLERDHGE